MQDIYDENGELFDIKLTTHLIAIIDMLKTKEMMTSEESECYLKDFYLIFASIHEMIKERYPLIAINSYSDNIVLAVDLDECSDVSVEAASFLELMSTIQGNIMQLHKIMIRGSVLIGEAYISRDLCYGKGFLDAYILESTKAKYPRIIVDESIINFCENAELLKADSDGCFYIDYLKDCNFDECVGKHRWCPALKWHKDCFEKNFDDYKKMPSITEDETKQKDKVFEKLKWFKNYHNEFCHQSGVNTYYFIEHEL